MATIDPDALLPNDRIRQAVLSGDVTQISRGATERYTEAGDTFELDGTEFEVTSVEERTLGELTDEDARREGSPSLQAYRDRLVNVHGGNFEWDDDSTVVTYCFERR
jgi:hypothetical protein